MTAWAIAESWAAASEVAALAYGVDLLLIRAPSRGRGPRPPEHVREPRKVAVYLTALISGADYAAIGRHLGLHKDTVSSHVAEGRASADDDGREAFIVALQGATEAALLRGRCTGAAQLAAARADLERRAADLERAAGVMRDAAVRLNGSDEAIRPLHPTKLRQVVAGLERAAA